MEGSRRAGHRVPNCDQDNPGPAWGPRGKAARDPSVRAARACGRAGRQRQRRLLEVGERTSGIGAGGAGCRHTEPSSCESEARCYPPALPAERALARTYSTIIGKIETKTIPMVTSEKFSFTTGTFPN